MKASPVVEKRVVMTDGQTVDWMAFVLAADWVVVKVALKVLKKAAYLVEWMGNGWAGSMAAGTVVVKAVPLVLATAGRLVDYSVEHLVLM